MEEKIQKFDVSSSTVKQYAAAAHHYKDCRENYERASELFSKWMDGETRSMMEKTGKKLEVAYEGLRQAAVKLANEALGIRCLGLPYDNCVVVKSDDEKDLEEFEKAEASLADSGMELQA